jgi:lipid II:glycine glycyltransferase (peptidoglycan interpeptide bridge formation enzyme)
MRSPRGHYCQLSTWLESFQSYGFDFDILVVNERSDGPIVGGIGVIKFDKPFFKYITAPIGPIIDTNFEYLFKDILNSLYSYAKAVGAFLLQLQIPSAKDHYLPWLLPYDCVSTDDFGSSGIVFGTASAPNQMLWIKFPEETAVVDWNVQMLKHFNENTRRNILIAEKAELKAHEASNEKELREAYAIIEDNGRERGYATRSWRDFRSTLLTQVEKKQAIVFIAYHQQQALGAHYGVLAGQRYSYLMGGTRRSEKDLKVGHFLHWTAIKKARELRLNGYDLTSGGSPGVMRFKMGFRPEHIQFITPRSFILSKTQYQIFIKCYPFLRKNKMIIAKILSFASGRKN